MKSNQSSNALSPYAIRDVVSPRAVTYNGTFHQWFTTGVRRSRTLPTICVHMWSVTYVSFHELRGRAGQHSGRSAAAGILWPLGAIIGTVRPTLDPPLWRAAPV